MKDLQRETIMSNVSFGSVYGNNYDLSGYASTTARRPGGQMNHGSYPSNNSDSGGLADCFSVGAATLDVTASASFQEGLDASVSASTGISLDWGCAYDSIMGNDSGDSSSCSSGGFSSDIGGESGYGGCNL